VSVAALVALHLSGHVSPVDTRSGLPAHEAEPAVRNTVGVLEAHLPFSRDEPQSRAGQRATLCSNVGSDRCSLEDKADEERERQEDNQADDEDNHLLGCHDRSLSPVCHRVPARVYRRRPMTPNPPPSKDWLAFQRLKPALVKAHGHTYALMHDGVLAGVYADREQATEAARARWPFGPYSICEIREERLPPEPPRIHRGG
jgi:hypothetical protein